MSVLLGGRDRGDKVPDAGKISKRCVGLSYFAGTMTLIIAKQLMIMEAMRLSLVDHEEHQRKLVETPKGATTPPAASGEHSGDSSRRPSIGMPSFSGSGTPTKSHGQSSSAASKLFSKFGNRSRSSSSASNKQGGGEQRNVSFAPIPVKNPPRSGSTLTQPSQLPTPTSPISRTPPSSLNPAMPAPVAPVMTLADSTSVSDPPPSAGLPRLSMDMAPLSPDHPPRNSMNMATQRRAPLQRAETEMSEAPSETGGRTAYAQLDSDEE